MSAVASQITRLSTVYSAVCSGAHQGKHQSSALQAFVRGIHWWPRWTPLRRTSNVENVSIWWRHHVLAAVRSRSKIFIRVSGHRMCYNISSEEITWDRNTKMDASTHKRCRIFVCLRVNPCPVDLMGQNQAGVGPMPVLSVRLIPTWSCHSINDIFMACLQRIWFVAQPLHESRIDKSIGCRSVWSISGVRLNQERLLSETPSRTKMD